MSRTDQKNRNDVIEFATLLYGGAWRQELAKTLGTTRRNLDLWLSAETPLPASVVVGVVNQMNTHLAKQRREHADLELRIMKLRGQIASPTRNSAKGKKQMESTVKVPTYRAQLSVVDPDVVNA